jgi:hypothetical protein
VIPTSVVTMPPAPLNRPEIYAVSHQQTFARMQCAYSASSLPYLGMTDTSLGIVRTNLVPIASSKGGKCKLLTRALDLLPSSVDLLSVATMVGAYRGQVSAPAGIYQMTESLVTTRQAGVQHLKKRRQEEKDKSGSVFTREPSSDAGFHFAACCLDAGAAGGRNKRNAQA